MEVLTANHESRDLTPMSDWLAQKPKLVIVMVNDEKPVVFSALALPLLLSLLDSYGEWSLEYSVYPDEVAGVVHTFDGNFYFGLGRI
jgi:hypothetical protein